MDRQSANYAVLRKMMLAGIVLLSSQACLAAKGAIPFDYSGPLADIKNGCFIYIDDGNICLQVKSHSSQGLVSEVIVPGTLKEHKGINIPDIKLRFSGLTEKDKNDIEFSVKNKVDYVAQSFVRTKNDILCFKDLVKGRLPDCKIIAKIENRQGINNIDQIIKFTLKNY